MKSLLWSEDEFLHKISKVPLQKIHWAPAQAKNIELWIRRDDLLDPELSGNKLYKLYYNLVNAQEQGWKTLLSFGGAYSNHLHALAAAGHRFGFKTIGVIRGEAPTHLSQTPLSKTPLSKTLVDAQSWGMQLYFISRETYLDIGQSIQHESGIKKKSDLQSKSYDPQINQSAFNLLLEKIRAECGDFYMIPEGGSNCLGVKGASALGQCLQETLNQDYTAVCLASGTGTTLAGVAAGLNNRITAIGFSVLKGAGDLGTQVSHQISSLQIDAQNWRLISGFHGGGYAKKLPQYLFDFLQSFERETHIDLDPVYTLKMCWGVTQLLQQDYWAPSSRLVLIHSGGLQGRRGFSL